MTTYQPTIQTTAGYIPANRVYAPTTTWEPAFALDCSFMGTKFGLLKIFQQVFIILATILYISTIVGRAGLIEFGSTESASLLYFALLFIWLPIVHVLMWTYLLHKVEKFSKYPWYTIEFAICGGGGILCLIASVFPIYIVFVVVTNAGSCFAAIFTLFAAFLFIYNFYLVNQKRSMRLPLQGPESAI